VLKVIKSIDNLTTEIDIINNFISSEFLYNNNENELLPNDNSLKNIVEKLKIKLNFPDASPKRN
jgi:hypothetical protein